MKKAEKKLFRWPNGYIRHLERSFNESVEEYSEQQAKLVIRLRLQKYYRMAALSIVWGRVEVEPAALISEERKAEPVRKGDPIQVRLPW